MQVYSEVVGNITPVHGRATEKLTLPFTLQLIHTFGTFTLWNEDSITCSFKVVEFYEIGVWVNVLFQLSEHLAYQSNLLLKPLCH